MFLLYLQFQVSQLILVNEAYEHGERDGFPDDLTPSAESVKHSTAALTSAARQLAGDYNEVSGLDQHQ